MKVQGERGVVSVAVPLFSHYPEQSRKGGWGGVCISAEVEPQAAVMEGCWEERSACRCL